MDFEPAQLPAEPDQQSITDILVAIDEVLHDEGCHHLPADGPTVDRLRWAVEKELEGIGRKAARVGG